jgi:hypothetical protein
LFFQCRPLLVVVIQAVLIFVNIIIDFNIMENVLAAALVDTPANWGSEYKIPEVCPESKKERPSWA